MWTFLRRPPHSLVSGPAVHQYSVLVRAIASDEDFTVEVYRADDTVYRSASTDERFGLAAADEPYGRSNGRAMYLPYTGASVPEYPWDTGAFDKGFRR